MQLAATITPDELDEYPLPNNSQLPIGAYLASVREDAQMSQAQLAQAANFSAATLSRIESGEKALTIEELDSMLTILGTPQAKRLKEYLQQSWDQLPRPPFDHPNLAALWQANVSLRQLAALRVDPVVKAFFLRQVDLYEAELRRVATFLHSREHQIAYIGSIGVGKSTALCKLTNLMKPGEEKLDRQIVLETGAGGITLCEVHITQGPRYGLRIVPRGEDSIRRDVEDFCDYLVANVKQAPADPAADEEEGDPLSISKEVVRAIRNMAGLAEKPRKENGRRIRVDPAKELAKEYGSAQELCIHVLTKMDLLRRNRRDAWYPENHPHSPEQWLQEIFSEVNNGRHPEFTLPQKIEVIVPDPIFGSGAIPLRIIDTKGIDQTAERQDLECHFDDPRTLVVLCSRFNDAPEVALQSLLRRAKEAGARDIALKTMLLALPRPDEALAVKYDDGTRVEDDEEGYELKRDQIHLRLDAQGLSEIPVEFFNAREEAAKELRQRFLGRITNYRQHYAAQLTELSAAVTKLAENREDEGSRAAFDHVMADLNAWLADSANLHSPEEPIQEPLVLAIGNTRYASTVRAAVRRAGDWYNLDYYHHLSYGVRKVAVDRIGVKMGTLRVLVKNLTGNDGLAPARAFLEGVLNRIEAAVDEAFRRIQATGREAFKQSLAKDFEFWSRCQARWGKGPGYRAAIRDMTDEEFDQQCLKEVQEHIAAAIKTEWAAIIELMRGLLQEKGL